MQLVDTNIISELMRPAPDTGVLRWLEQTASTRTRLAISPITLDELVFGLTRRPRAASFALFELLASAFPTLAARQGAGQASGTCQSAFFAG